MLIIKYCTKKLSMHGIKGAVLNWLRSYLADRKQCLPLNGRNSQFCSIKSGVPQGLILGPLLFLIFTNNLTKSSIFFLFHLFSRWQNLKATVTCQLRILPIWKMRQYRGKSMQSSSIKAGLAQFGVRGAVLLRFTSSRCKLKYVRPPFWDLLRFDSTRSMWDRHAKTYLASLEEDKLVAALKFLRNIDVD